MREPSFKYFNWVSKANPLFTCATGYTVQILDVHSNGHTLS